MANPRNEARPLSPHLGIWKWGPGMTVSIVHRATGTGLAVVGSALLVWWLVALSSGEAVYAGFVDTFTLHSGKLNILGWVFGVGLTLALFQHMASGVRHLFLDTGANFELKGNRTSALVTFGVALVATLVFWVVIVEKLNG
ncbi:MAG: succinate dehydrogenase, cytochrome b556 subunit [Pseudomonadota bacterium]